jgi:hypothetical protein
MVYLFHSISREFAGKNIGAKSLCTHIMCVCYHLAIAADRIRLYTPRTVTVQVAAPQQRSIVQQDEAYYENDGARLEKVLAACQADSDVRDAIFQKLRDWGYALEEEESPWIKSEPCDYDVALPRNAQMCASLAKN